jgi:uncharacterized membrane protein (DUF373 family)
MGLCALGESRDNGAMTDRAGHLADNSDRPEAGLPAARPARQPPAAYSRWRGVSGLIWVLEHAQDAVMVIVGIMLIVLAGVLLVSGIVGFASGSSGPVSLAAPGLIDRILLVLILVEIVHTVVLSLRTHHLAARPFIVVGLVAVIRRILFVLTPTPGVKQVGTSELALLIAMVAVFVAGLIAVGRFAEPSE